MLERYVSEEIAKRAGIRLQRPNIKFNYGWWRPGVAYIGKNAYGDSFLIAVVTRSNSRVEYFLGSYPDRDISKLRGDDRIDLALSAVTRDLRVSGRDIGFSIATLLSKKQPKL